MTHARLVLLHEVALLKRTSDTSSLPDNTFGLHEGELTASDFKNPEELLQLGGESLESLAPHPANTGTTAGIQTTHNVDTRQTNSRSGSTLFFDNQEDSGSTQGSHLGNTPDTITIDDDQADQADEQDEPASRVPAPRRS